MGIMAKLFLSFVTLLTGGLLVLGFFQFEEDGVLVVGLAFVIIPFLILAWFIERW
jgi:hypothetical protein